jgi:aspartyl-tRNA(Asn)/glutamyl-tRNA(Gln) amidotransferase subunit B
MMEVTHPGYEAVIGLEVHAQLRTATKLFCGDETAFGAEPNTQISPITLGHPGTLPMMNKAAVEHAIRLGLVCHSEIQLHNYFARKNYFYPDLPKGYQISQHTTPICQGGYVEIQADHRPKKIRLIRIHLEEDAGKSLHDQDPEKTCLDFNRAGTPLVEIVSEPDIRSAEEAFVFLTEIRKLVRWIGVCDGNMEEGSLRCDANISVRLKGDQKLGTRVEVKNLNSIRNVRKAIEVELARLIELHETGQTIQQETRSFDADHDRTFTIRVKEDADDYRYFPDPDLTPFQFTRERVEEIRSSLPTLPETLKADWISRYGLHENEAAKLVSDKDLAHYFEASLSTGAEARTLANFLTGSLMSKLHESGRGWSTAAIGPDSWKALTGLVLDGRISFSAAASRLLPRMMEQPMEDPLVIATSLDLLQDAGDEEIHKWVEEALARMPEKVLEYQKGKKGLIGLFMGEVKRLSRGKADPHLVSELLKEVLQKKQ